MYAVDFKIYTRNRPFRLVYAKKHGKTCLVPWDMSEWKELTFDTEVEKESWFEGTLVTGADDEYVTRIKPHIVQPQIVFRQEEKKKHIEPKQQQKQQQKQQKQPDEQQPIDPEQLSLAKQLVSCLSDARSAGSNGWDSWAKVLWSIGPPARSQLFCRGSKL